MPEINRLSHDPEMGEAVAMLYTDDTGVDLEQYRAEGDTASDQTGQ